MLVGYARVSTTDQDLTLQREKLRACEQIFEERASGTTAARPKLQECLNFVRKGDTLIVTRLDRLARSTLHLCQIADRLAKQEVHFRVLDQHIDTTTPEGRFLFNTLAAVAQFETELRAQRQREGIEKAKQNGVHFGRRKALTPAEVISLQTDRAKGETLRVLRRRYGIGKTALYRYLKQPQAQPAQVEAAD